MNWVDFFRYSGKYEDVFVEDDHYLYACAEPYSWAYMLCVNEYHLNNGELIRHDCSGAGVNYLQTLKPAAHAIAERILSYEALITDQLLEEAEGETLLR